MKKLALFLIMIFLTVLPLMAQEEDEITGTYIQMAESGTLTEESDGMYLTLEGISDITLWAMTTPSFRTGMYTTFFFVGDWSFAEDVAATAILTTEDASVLLSLSSAPEYDMEANTITYMVTVEEVTPFDEDAKESVAPEAFDTATLFINIDNDFFSALQAGMSERVNSARDTTSVPCSQDPYCDD